MNSRQDKTINVAELQRPPNSWTSKLATDAFGKEVRFVDSFFGHGTKKRRVVDTRSSDSEYVELPPSTVADRLSSVFADFKQAKHDSLPFSLSHLLPHAWDAPSDNRNRLRSTPCVNKSDAWPWRVNKCDCSRLGCYHDKPRIGSWSNWIYELNRILTGFWGTGFQHYFDFGLYRRDAASYAEYLDSLRASRDVGTLIPFANAEYPEFFGTVPFLEFDDFNVILADEEDDPWRTGVGGWLIREFDKRERNLSWYRLAKHLLARGKPFQVEDWMLDWAWLFTFFKPLSGEKWEEGNEQTSAIAEGHIKKYQGHGTDGYDTVDLDQLNFFYIGGPPLKDPGLSGVDIDWDDQEVCYDGVKLFDKDTTLRLEIKDIPKVQVAAASSGDADAGKIPIDWRGCSTEEKGQLYQECRWIQVIGQLKWDHGKHGFWEIHPKSEDDIVIARSSGELPEIQVKRGAEDPKNPFPKGGP
jgi:hypothetical protein